MKLIYILLFLCLFSACKDNSVDSPKDTAPKDTPPVIQSFTATPPSVEIGQKVKFMFSVADAERLDSLFLKYGDSTGRSFLAGRQKTLVDSVEHSYLSSGTKIATLTAYADGKTAVKYVTLSVNQNLPPVVDVDSLKGVEGQSSSSPVAKFAHDPEGKPVSISLKSGNPSVNVSVGSDSIRYSGINTDMNGSFPVTFSVSDGVNVIDKVVPVVIVARDDIYGRAHDAMEGTLPASLKPELVLNAPYDLSKSYLKIDGNLVAMKANGNFVIGKLPNTTHTLEVALVNLIGDSSYVATYTLPAGDRTFNPLVNTNAGTGFSLTTEKRFLYLTNTRLVNSNDQEHVIKGIDFSCANDYVIWIARKDTVDPYYGHVKAFTVEEQDTIEQTIKDEIYKYLPDSLQPRIHKAALSESLPAGNGFTPNNHVILILKQDGESGTLARYMTNKGVISSARITYDSGTPFGRKATVIQEVLSAIAAPNDLDDISEPIWMNRSCLAETTPTPYMTPSDINCLYLPILFGNGTSEESVLKLR